MKMKIEFFSLLAIAFIVLKLCKVITWSWWLVLLPLYIGVIILIVVIVLVLIFEKIFKR